MSRTIAVVYGKFQVPELPSLERRIQECLKVQNIDEMYFAVLTGEAPFTSKYPMSYNIISRGFLKCSFPVVEFPTDEVTCEHLDMVIRGIVTPNNNVVVCTIGDAEYRGKYETLPEAWMPEHDDFNTPNSINYPDTSQYRLGMIDGSSNGYASTIGVMDAAVVWKDQKVLLGTKKGRNGKLCFPGGHIDPKKDSSAEDTVIREVKEETGLVITPEVPIKYLGSYMTSDFRKIGDKDKLMTFFYLIKTITPTPPKVEGADDLSECNWYVIDTLTSEDIIPGHVCLLDTLKHQLKK